MTLRAKRLLRRWIPIAFFLFALTVLLGNRWVINSTDSYIYDNVGLLPENRVGIVLGTSPYTRGGGRSDDFFGRIEAAAKLYDAGKIRHIIVSGANPDATYNEPRRMWQELVKRGVPQEALTMDFAGFRTFDTVARAHRVFGLERYTLITQKYHTYRAVFLARKMEVPAVAYIAPGTQYRHPWREIFARVKAILDLFVLRTEPRFVGEPERLPTEGPGDEDLLAQRLRP
ncbi:ElyC/SanA/YdcF family protein [Algiphilus sp.]|uniref:SanA/YdcF family protein n=1 Tax=Algiphilus sp. TaxID=1872431 RepID=UPI001CA6C030|nr:ElyC/SanA/YdcF family protein [Algiphilus sp.]MBY8965459.1 YdcF family protein [Algiphilus acroporae]MCI5063980.1 YdcF family protein [Algiphilus sp.]MCI5104903.1 YdcF family protein [Algiphilus sp.]MCR9090000.1 YdcF family protein [Pseudomonadota bacterium]